jgi:uncharacterized membrane protein
MTDATLTAAAPASAARPLTAGIRISEIDMLRGLVIVLMALDHVRDYFFLGGPFAVELLNPEQTTPALYITRWITHLCAPTFVFLAGVSAYLQFAKGKTTSRLSMFLFTRGLWLIVLEATVLSFGWSFWAPYLFFLQVIWAIGWSMLALAALVWLPRIAVLVIGVAIVTGHNLLDPITPQQFGDFGWAWTFLHEGGIQMVGGAPAILFAYPILAWIGVIAFGYGMGALFIEPPEKRDRSILILGVAMLVLFAILRGFNLYGDASAQGMIDPGGVTASWTRQPDAMSAVMVFFDVQKYPPSLQFVLVTLGIVFVFWPVLARLRGPVASVLNTFGAVPFFFYVLHVYLVHALAIVANAAFGRDATPLFNYMLNSAPGSTAVAHLGFPLYGVYLAWIVVLALLYPLCRHWQQLKARRRDWWLSYL